MELNNETNVTTTEHAASVAVVQPADISEIPPAPKKSGTVKKVITAVLACAVVAGGLFAAKTFLKPDPEKVIKAATVSTYEQQKKFENKIYSEIPAAKTLFGGGQIPDSEISFSLTLKSVSGFNYAEMISAVLSGTTVSGNSVTSQTDKLADIEIALSHRETPLVSANIFLSPELATVSVPELSNKMFSVVPSSLAEDYKNSIFYDPHGISDDDLKLIQDSLISALDNNSLTSSDIKKFESDICAIIAKAAANAQYGYDEQQKLYTAALPGSDVKNSAIELYRYVYLDSKLAALMEKMLSPTLTMAGEESYSDAVQRLIGDIESSTPELPTTIELDIQNGAIKTAYILCKPASDSGTDFARIRLDFSENLTTVKIDTAITAGDETISSLAVTAARFENGVYSISANIENRSAGSELTMPFELSIADNGTFNCKFNMGIASNDSLSASFGFTADGTVISEKGVLNYDIPVCTADITANGQNYNAEFSLNGSSGPITTIPAEPANHTPIFSMTESDVDLLFKEMRIGIRPIIGKITGILMGK